MVKRTGTASVEMDPLACVSWRTFMRGAEPVLAGRLVRRECLTTHDDHTVALARVFVLAKHGYTEGARQQLKSIRNGQCASGDDQANSEFILVDGHVRIYEDQPFIQGTQMLLNRAKMD